MPGKGHICIYIHPSIASAKPHTRALALKLQNSAAVLSTGMKKRPDNPHLKLIDFKILLHTYKRSQGLGSGIHF